MTGNGSGDPGVKHCPECGGTAVTATASNLSRLGYLAEDVSHLCGDCGATWAHGHPQGDFDRDDLVSDVQCDVCREDVGLLYQLHRGAEKDLALRFKCPTCHYVWIIERDLIDSALTVGYPSVMGTTEEAVPWGYDDEA